MIFQSLLVPLLGFPVILVQTPQLLLLLKRFLGLLSIFVGPFGEWEVRFCDDLILVALRLHVSNELILFEQGMLGQDYLPLLCLLRKILGPPSASKKVDLLREIPTLVWRFILARYLVSHILNLFVEDPILSFFLHIQFLQLFLHGKKVSLVLKEKEKLLHFLRGQRKLIDEL